MADSKVIDLSHLNIPDARTIDLSHLGIPDAQPQASISTSDPRDQRARNTSPVDVMPQERPQPNCISGPTMLAPSQAPSRTQEYSRPKNTGEVLQNLWRLYLEGGSTNRRSPHRADPFYIDDNPRLLRDLHNRFLMDAQNGAAMREPQTGEPFGSDPTGLTPADHSTSSDEKANSLANSTSEAGDGQNVHHQITESVKQALRTAMPKEHAPLKQYNDYLWIIEHESGGTLGNRNPYSSTRGLFQLIKDNYNLNPHGEASFGNAIEECQGGIRYIKKRYGSATKARAF